MRIFIDPARFLSVSCEADGRIVFDRQRGSYHLLPAAAARLWEQIEAGGQFELETIGAPDGAELVRLLNEAGLLGARTDGDVPTGRRHGEVEARFHYRGSQVPLFEVFGR